MVNAKINAPIPFAILYFLIWVLPAMELMVISLLWITVNRTVSALFGLLPD
jgi:hypothetical protein